VLRAPISGDAILARVRLAAWLVDRSARDYLPTEEAYIAVIDKHSLSLITGRTQREKQLAILEEFAAFEEISIEDLGNFVRIEWPNLVNFLPIRPQQSGTGQPHADADSDAHADADADVDSDAHADASPEGFDKGDKGFGASRNRAAYSADSDSDEPTDSPYLPMVPEAIQAGWPELNDAKVAGIAEAAWALYESTGASTTVIGFKPWLSAHWHEIDGLTRPPDA
jgi:hypothetical protein